VFLYNDKIDIHLKASRKL